jgi:hypothetical protein
MAETAVECILVSYKAHPIPEFVAVEVTAAQRRYTALISGPDGLAI